VTRLSQQVGASPGKTTTSGFSERVLPGARVLQLQWSPSSRARDNKALRTAIALALQGDRTSDSVLPAGIPGHLSSFPLGGKVTPKVTWKSRINLTLAYDPTAPNAGDLADTVRNRLEDTGGLSVRLAPGSADADLVLVDRKAWTPTALSWLQPYVDDPLPATEPTVTATTNAYRASTDEAGSERLLGTLQRQAASDLVLLPISQSDEILWVRGGADVNGGSYGPGWQLGLFGISAS
jgi:peptide/nickel transport system substrate-binding protein